MTATVSIALSRGPRVLLADDHPQMLSALREMLAPHFDVVAAVSDGEAALDAAARTNPDLFVSDIAMPGLNGFKAARELNRRGSSARVVFLTCHEDNDYISEALRLGANGYVVKRRMHLELIPALNLALGGQYFISPHAFVAAKPCPIADHVMEFYLDEDAFFRRMSESIPLALSEGDVVFVLLGNAGLNCVRKRLIAAGVNLLEAVSARKYIALCIENVIPSLIRRGWPDTGRFEAYFSSALENAAARAGQNGAEARVFSDVMATLLAQGYDASLAGEVEAIWNDLVRRHSCSVYCGYPATYLSSGENRAALSKICSEHSSVIPIDRRVPVVPSLVGI